MSGEIVIAPATINDSEPVTTLWRTCGLVASYNPPDADFAFALGKPGSDVLVGRLDGAIVASVMVGHDGHRGWIYYVAVDPELQGHGYGATMVAAAESWLSERAIRKIQLMVRSSNEKVLGFYDRLGYERSDVTVMQRWLEPGHP